MVDVGIYARLSRAAEEGQQDTSIDRQIEQCRSYAELRGWRVHEVYCDPGSSGYDGRWRPEFERLLEDAYGGLVGGLLAWRCDRLSRNRADWHRIMSLVDGEVALASATEGIDSSTPAGRVMVDLLAMFSRMESEAISQRTRAAKQAQAAAGRPHSGGPRPFGYRYEGGGLVPEEGEADAARAAVGRLLTGDSLAGVTRWTNDRGVLAPSGKPWTPSTLMRALSSPTMAGVRVHRGARYRGVWEPILTLEQHEQLAALRSDPARTWQHRGMPRRHLLAGFLVCGREGCGMKLRSKPYRGRPRYECQKLAGRGCGKLTISAAQVERVVLERVWAALDSDALPQALAARPDTGLAAQLDADERQLAWLGQTMGADPDPGKRVAFLAAVATVEERLRATRAAIARTHRAAVLAELPKGVAAVQRAWEHDWDLDRRRSFLSVLIDHVVVHPAPLGRRQGRAFRRERVEVHWRV